MTARAVVKEIRQCWSVLQQAVADARFWHDRYVQQADLEYEQQALEIEVEHNGTTTHAKAQHDKGLIEASKQYEMAVSEAEAELKKQVHDTNAVVDRTRAALGMLAADWADERWHGFSPVLREAITQTPQRIPELVEQTRSEAGSVPSVVRVGVVRQPDLEHPIQNAPALVPLIGRGHLLIVSRGDMKRQALLMLQSVVTRIVLTFPVLSSRFVFIDPLGLGDNFPFKLLPESIRGNMVYSEPDEIPWQMRELTEHLRRVNQKYLARDYDNIEAYNRDAGEVVEPYRFLCVADFPAQFDPDSATRLLSVAEKGVRTGVYILMHINLDSERPREFDLEALMRTATVIEAKSGKFSFPIVSGDGQKTQYDIVPDSAPGSGLFNELMQRVSREAEKGAFRGIPFERVALPPEEWWHPDNTSREIIEVPIGRTGARDDLYFWLGRRTNDGHISSHALIGGKTGSGKSTLFHVLITSLALGYSPDELELYLVDFKEGVEFKPYADFHLPHARVIAIESEREFGLSVLRRLQAELERRGALFKEVNAQDLTAYRDRTDQVLPRVVAIIDEFQILFSDQDAISVKAAQILDDLARRGRAFGIHLVMGSQSVRIADIPRSTYGQFATRIVLQAPEDEIAELLGPDNIAAAELLERPGEIIYNDDGGRKGGNLPGQVAILREEAIPRFLDLINGLAKDKELRRAASPPVVFRGNQASSLGDNRQLQQLYDLDDWPTARQVRDMLDLREWVAAEQPALAWLGEAIEIKPHTAVPFRRRGRSNLLIVGDSEEIAFGMIGATLISLPAFYRPEAIKFRIIDLSLKEEEWEDTAEHFAQHFDFYDTVVRERRGAAELLDEVAEMVEKRAALYRAGEDNLGPSVFLVVGGMHRLPELRAIPGKYGGDEPSDYARKLMEIAQRGPELGVYTILWCDNVKSFESAMGRSQLAHFDRRVALAMSQDDSQYLLSETAAYGLKRYRALLHDEEQSVALEKFKPYALPSLKAERADVIRHYAERLRVRLEKSK